MKKRNLKKTRDYHIKPNIGLLKRIRIVKFHLSIRLILKITLFY